MISITKSPHLEKFTNYSVKYEVMKDHEGMVNNLAIHEVVIKSAFNQGHKRRHVSQ